MWNLIDTGIHSAEENMQIDADLLSQIHPDDPPILHIYEWKRPSATYGHFLRPETLLDLKQAEALGIDLAKRPTGGGIIFHLFDLAFSALVPANHAGYHLATLDNYDFINKRVLLAVKTFFDSSPDLELLPDEPTPQNERCKHFCMAKPTKYDVMLGGRKIAGAAQRKKKEGYLHQGSIAITPPEEKILQKILLPETKVLEAMMINTYPILNDTTELPAVRKQLVNCLKEVFR